MSDSKKWKEEVDKRSSTFLDTLIEEKLTEHGLSKEAADNDPSGEIAERRREMRIKLLEIAYEVVKDGSGKKIKKYRVKKPKKD